MIVCLEILINKNSIMKLKFKILVGIFFLTLCVYNLNLIQVNSNDITLQTVINSVEANPEDGEHAHTPCQGVQTREYIDLFVWDYYCKTTQPGECLVGRYYVYPSGEVKEAEEGFTPGQCAS